VLRKDGSLDRARLRELVFANPAERQWLESLTHPAIRELTDARCESATGRYVLVAIPLLVETQGAKRFDRVLVVDCHPALQLARLQARDGSTSREAAQVLAAQVTREQRLAVADDVILNNGDIAALRDQVEKLHRHYLTAASQADRAVK
jgi:dephospho-CoA kinase